MTFLMLDKRTNDRTESPSTLLVRIQGDQSKFGRIEDISMEGIGCSCNPDLQKFAKDSFTIDLYNCNQGTLPKKLPVEVVSPRVNVKKISGKQTTILRTGARFEQLNLTQKKILRNFIDGFSTQPQTC